MVKAFEKGHRALTFHLKAQLTTHGTSGLGATKECLHLDYDKYTSQLSLFKVMELCACKSPLGLLVVAGSNHT